MDLWGGYKGARATPALDHSFALQAGESVASGHQTHLVSSGQFAFRSNRIPRSQLRGLDPLPDSVLYSFVNRRAVAMVSRHEMTFRPRIEAPSH
jgi:hypothetical protein